LEKCRNRSFPTFQKAFEEQVGQQVLAILMAATSDNISNMNKNKKHSIDSGKRCEVAHW
jgi:hypothetical protein